jgi:hypothetical protein
MLDDQHATQPVQGVLAVSYVLGELDADARKAMERRLEAEPALRGEVEEIRAHLSLHERVRKVAPRRGSFERLRARMKREGSFAGAVPGVHCMLRRAFMVALAVGFVAVVLLIAFGGPSLQVAAPDDIGEIVYLSPRPGLDQARREQDRAKLSLFREYDTGAYEASLWLPTGLASSPSTLEAGTDTEFRFLSTRRVDLLRGSFRGVEVHPGGVGEGPFVITSPHGRVQVDRGRLTVAVTRDGAETQVTVLDGGARVYGRDSDRPFVVPAGWCTFMERGRLPHPARPVLKLEISRGSTAMQVVARMVNDGYEPVRVRRAVDRDRVFQEPIYLLHVSHASEFSVEGNPPENVTLQPWPVTPEPEPGMDHSGEVLLARGEDYSFTFDISPLLRSTPLVDHWLRLEYRGDLYAPTGQARIRIDSRYLKLDRRR